MLSPGEARWVLVGAMIGTIMAANVFRVMIPNQLSSPKICSRAAPPTKYGKMGKQRSLHNNYLTLPVLLFMVSNHYPFLYSHPSSWLVVALIVIAGGMVRHFPQSDRCREAREQGGLGDPGCRAGAGLSDLLDGAGAGGSTSGASPTPNI